MLVLILSVLAARGSYGPERANTPGSKASCAGGFALPFGGSPATGPLLSSVKEARRHFTVALEGGGSSED